MPIFEIPPSSGDDRWYVRFAKNIEKIPGVICRALKNFPQAARGFFGRSITHEKADPKIRRLVAGITSVERSAKALSGTIKDFQEGGGSLENVLEAYAPIREYHDADTSFSPFLRTMDMLFEFFEKDSTALRELVMPLMQRVLVEKQVHPGGGDEIGATILFLGDMRLLDSIYEKADIDDRFSQITSMAIRHLREERNHWGQTLQSPFHDTYSLFRTTLPRCVASSLVLSTGKVNLGLSQIVKRVFLESTLHPREVVMGLSRSVQGDEETAIRRVLDTFCSDGRLLEKLEALQAPPPDSFGERVVNATLGHPLERRVTDQEARGASLCALLTNWRQGHVGSCHLTSVVQYVSDAATNWVLDDCIELISKGCLERNISGILYPFWGIERAIPSASVRRLSKTDIGKSVLGHKGFLNACTLLGITAVDFFKRCPDRYTIRSVFKTICVEKGYSSEKLERAIFAFEAEGESPLRRVHENAVGSMAYPPAFSSPPRMSSPYRGAFEGAMRRAFIKVAIREGVLGKKAKLRLAPHFVPFVTSKDLFGSFSRLRHCYCPAQDRSKHVVWTIALETDEGLKIANNADDSAEILKILFLEMCRAAGATEQQMESLKKEVSGKELLKKFNPKSSKERAPALLSYRVGLMSKFVFEAYVDFRTWIIPDSFRLLFGGTTIKGPSSLFTFAKRVQKRKNLNETLLAHGEKHDFRLLPNHPSVIHWASHQKEFHSRWKKMVTQPAGEYTSLWANLEQSMKNMGLARARRDEVFEEVRKKVGETPICSLHEYLRVFDSALKRAVVADEVDSKGISAAFKRIYRTVLYKEKERDQRYVDGAVYKTLLENNELEMRKLFLYFADPNWIGSKHLVYWLNPRTMSWQTSHGSEGDPYHHRHDYPLRSGVKVASHLHVKSVRRDAKVKQVHLLEKEAYENLARLEKSFSNNWKTYKEKKQECETKGLLARDAIDALRRCIDIKEEYLKAIDELGRTILPRAKEIRFTSRLNRELQELLFHPEGLQREMKALRERKVT